MSFDESPSFLPYGKVVIHTENNGDVSAQLFEYSDATHRTFECDSIFDNVSSADALYILDKIAGYSYKPFSADGALLDPAAQLGDIVTCNGVTSILGKIQTNYDSLCAATVEAPQSEEINHEYNYETKEERDLNAGLSTKLTEGQSYGGVSIDDDGFNATSAGGAKVVINSTELSFYYGSQRVLYFDPVGRKYLFTGDVNIEDGAITFSKLSSAAQTRTDNELLSNGLYSGGTFISGTSIYSPTIFANTFNVFPNNMLNGTGAFNIYGEYNNSIYHFFSAAYSVTDTPYVSLYSPQGAYMYVGQTPGGTVRNVIVLSGDSLRVEYGGIQYAVTRDSNGFLRAL